MDDVKKVAGMVWYRLADYDQCRAVMADRHTLPATFSEWRMKAEQAEKMMQRQGWTTTRAYINPAEFPAWCAARGLNVDAKARNEFANLIARDAADHLD